MAAGLMLATGAILLVVTLQMAWAGLWSFFPIVGLSSGVLLGQGFRAYRREQDEQRADEIGRTPGTADAVFPRA